MTNPIEVLLVEDHQVVRHGLRLLIESQPNMRVVGEASSGEEAIDLLKTTTPNLVVFDVSLPGMSGIELARQLQKDEDSRKVPLLALTANEDRAYMTELLRLGVLGYLFKRSAAKELLQAIERVAHSERFLDPAIMDQMVCATIDESGRNGQGAVQPSLSDREVEVLRLIACGYTNKEAARLLDISAKTIETHKARGMVKLQLRSRAELIRFAATQGWIKGML